MIKTVLFDLDGTLLNTALDFVFALNVLLEEAQRPAITLPGLRPMISHGANAMVQYAFNLDTNHLEFSHWRERFLDLHYRHIAQFTQAFPGINALLTTLDNLGLQWGIVTNKSEQLTYHLLNHITFPTPPACIVCGDTLAQCKPAPEPLWHACALSNTAPSETLFIGDAQNDILAGQRAGTLTLAALYGYIAKTAAPQTWGAHGMVAQATEILPWIEANLLKNKIF